MQQAGRTSLQMHTPMPPCASMVRSRARWVRTTSQEARSSANRLPLCRLAWVVVLLGGRQLSDAEQEVWWCKLLGQQ